MLLKTKDRQNERSQTKPIKATKLLKTKENGYERSHYVVENKRPRKRTKPNEPKSSLVSQLSVCGSDLLGPPHPPSPLPQRGEGRVSSGLLPVPPKGAGEKGIELRTSLVLQGGRASRRSRPGADATQSPWRAPATAGPALLRSGDFDLSGAFGYRGHEPCSELLPPVVRSLSYAACREGKDHVISE